MNLVFGDNHADDRRSSTAISMTEAASARALVIGAILDELAR